MGNTKDCRCVHGFWQEECASEYIVPACPTKLSNEATRSTVKRFTADADHVDRQYREASFTLHTEEMQSKSVVVNDRDFDAISAISYRPEKEAFLDPQ
jgi:hypothetical protein